MSKTLSGDEVTLAIRTMTNDFGVVLLRDKTTKEVFVDVANLYTGSAGGVSSELWLTDSTGVVFDSTLYDFLFCIPAKNGMEQLYDLAATTYVDPETTTDPIPRLTSIEFVYELTNQENDYFGQIQKAYIPISKTWTLSYTFEPFGASFDSLYFGVSNISGDITRAANGVLATADGSDWDVLLECFEDDVGNAQYGFYVALILGNATCPPWESEVSPGVNEYYEVFRGQKGCITTTSVALNARGTNQLSVSMIGAIGYITGCKSIATMFG